MLLNRLDEEVRTDEDDERQRDLEQAFSSSPPHRLGIVPEGINGNSNDDGTSNHDGSSVTGTGETSADGKHSHSASVNAKDEKRVALSKFMLMGVLLTTALVIASLVYINVAANERGDFETQFATSAHQIIHMANKNVKSVYMSIESMSIMFPSAAHHSGETLPYVTVPDFEAFGESARSLSKASLIAFAPLLHTWRELHAWNAYSANHTNWIDEGRSLDSAIVHIQEERKARGTLEEDDETTSTSSNAITPFVYKVNQSTGSILPENGNGLYAPLWEMSPVPNDTSSINFNLASNALFAHLVTYTTMSALPILSQPIAVHEHFHHMNIDTHGGSPTSILVQPVFDGFEHGQVHSVVGVLVAVIPWVDFFNDVLAQGQRDMVVVADSCGINNTFVIHGEHAEFLGSGDLHDHRFSAMEKHAVFVEFDPSNEIEHCHHVLHIYPTEALQQEYVTHAPILYAAFIVAMFLGTGAMFLVYDYLVSARQSNTQQKANRATAIVRGLFPTDVAAQLFGSDQDDDCEQGGKGVKVASGKPLDSNEAPKTNTTIARLYPAATVLFADIAGFTAWSSTRDPHQVFTLLESIFQAFDVLATKHGIYKVETVGDCYVAVCGIPKHKPDHAVQMVRFARSAQSVFQDVIKSLEMTLGPDTAELGMRVGMHSGPVTAGVLRGDRARFQLFGDTVNTASRMETSGRKGMVHLSEQTANELIKHGKKDWIMARDDVVVAKGKGKLVTFWFKDAASRSNSLSASSSTGKSVDVAAPDPAETSKPESTVAAVDKKPAAVPKKTEPRIVVDEKVDRIVEWNSKMLIQLLEPIVTRRKAVGKNGASAKKGAKDLTAIARQMGSAAMVVNEVVEIIEMPPFVRLEAVDNVVLNEEVIAQVHSYVKKIANMYNENPFHNFEHASHVAMSVNKMLARIVAPYGDDHDSAPNLDEHLHDHTYGIKSDPTTHFTVVLAALIHDVDHPGVSNAQLIKEQPGLGRLYENRSVAEQRSVNLAWTALLSDEYSQLRAALFDTEDELYRFRQLLVNSVIATDIFDGELCVMRKNRWSKAFDLSKVSSHSQNNIDQHRKATIVIEHLIQASDIAHTMQHWHVYLKWNQRLFDEMLRAYRDGRSDKDPSDGWVDGELWFFDNYIIPLANKLKECGVFGVSSDECLTYALQNRSEWEAKGLATVERYIAEFEQKLATGANGGLVLPPASVADKTDAAIKQSVRGLEAKLNIKKRIGGNSAAA